MPPLHRELGKKRPFDEPAQELYLAIMRTAAVLETDGAQLFRDAELSGATYNVLRILRGATMGPEAPGEVTCGHIARHLVSPVPDVTRLIDRLEKAGLAERNRSSNDRRVVHVRITAAGLKLLADLDEQVLTMHRRQFAHLSKAEIVQLIGLLEKAREQVTGAAAGEVGEEAGPRPGPSGDAPRGGKR